MSKEHLAQYIASLEETRQRGHQLGYQHDQDFNSLIDGMIIDATKHFLRPRPSAPMGDCIVPSCHALDDTWFLENNNGMCGNCVIDQELERESRNQQDIELHEVPLILCGKCGEVLCEDHQC